MNMTPAPHQLKPDADDARVTPMMAQYLDVKRQNPGLLLFYRMGDFYELFFDDAEMAARTLGIALTKRGKHLGQDIPMCGVPVHAMDHYLNKLIRGGHRVAVCEQMEDPAEARKRGSKSVVKRDVVRVITPGTLTEDSLLESGTGNYLAALALHRGTGEAALAYADISTGELAVAATSLARLAADLARVAPSEVLVADAWLGDETVKAALAGCGAAVSPLPASRFESGAAEHRLKQHFNVATVQGFGDFTRAETAALGALIDYIALTQIAAMPHLRPPRREAEGHGLLIDAATRANLEISRSLKGTREGSLLAVIDRTATAAGARRLAQLVAQPLAQASAINARLDGVSFFFNDEALCAGTAQALRGVPDLERALARVTARRGSPRDLAAIAEGIARAHHMAGTLAQAAAVPDVVTGHVATLRAAPLALAHETQAALAERLPLLARDGGFVAAGFHAELDQSRQLRDETRSVIAALQAHYVGHTGVRQLKIKHNNLLGYFIEVPQAQGEELRTADGPVRFHHRQSMAGAMRFSTDELAGLEQKIALAAERALAIELEIFADLCMKIGHAVAAISAAAAALADLDCLAGLASLARERRHVRPVVDDSTTFVVTQGRHPVVEAALAAAGDSAFTANDCTLGNPTPALWLLTGPNMAGKSTFLRQNALIVILAQMGAFVPAAHAHIGCVDRLFSRVGAADDLARGRSTFMVEMVETAAILNQATARSLVILDEIGRGTATFDGLSIAWATLEYLHEVNRCRALFATHYHELTSLAAILGRLACMTMAVKEWKGDIVFLHAVMPGAADRSYGIQAARLAGLPAPVITRAQEVLHRLEQQRDAQAPAAALDDLPLFRAAPAPVAAPAPDLLRQQLLAADPDSLTPRAALDLLYALQTLARDAAP